MLLTISFAKKRKLITYPCTIKLTLLYCYSNDKLIKYLYTYNIHQSQFIKYIITVDFIMLDGQFVSFREIFCYKSSAMVFENIVSLSTVCYYTYQLTFMSEYKQNTFDQEDH